jgi:hypothetical protein
MEPAAGPFPASLAISPITPPLAAPVTVLSTTERECDGDERLLELTVDCLVQPLPARESEAKAGSPR